MSRPTSNKPDDASETADTMRFQRPWPDRILYGLLRWITCVWLSISGGVRASGRENVPRTGGALLVVNHASFLDPLAVGVPLNRQLDFVARSTLFIPGLGYLLRHLGTLPIQREGMGASGLKETLRRLRRGGIVMLFPEGTRSRDGRLAALKSGISVLALKSRVPVIPAAVAGTFEAWPRNRLLPGRHALRVRYGVPILPHEIAELPHDAITAMIQERIGACLLEAQTALARDLQIEPASSHDTPCDQP